MRLVIAIAATLALAACEPGPPPPDSPSDTRISPPSGERDGRPPRNDRPSEDEDACRASRYQHLVGQRLPDPFPAEGTVRIFRTGDPVTMDHAPHRLNVEVHPRRDRIVRIFCG